MFIISYIHVLSRGVENFFDLSYWGYFVYMVLVAYHAGERCSPLRIIRGEFAVPFLIPHSSLFTPVFKLDKCLKKCYYTIVIKLICKFSVLSERK